MKKITSFIFTFIAITAITVSCSAFLEEAVLDQTNLDNYVKTDEEAVKFLYGGIAAIQNTVFGRDFISVVELTTDDTYFTTNDHGRSSLSSLTYDNQNIYVQNTWGNLYAVVSQMNILIDKLETPSEITAANKLKIMAQAKFIRSWAYFQLVQIWGEVPIIPTYLSTASNIRPERSSIDDVYKLIESDALYAFQNLKNNSIIKGNYVMPDTVKTNIAGGLEYYLPISKGAGALQLAKVYLAQKKYTEAESAVDYLLDKKELFELLPNYGDLFDVDKENTPNRCKEVLWEMEAQALSGYENTLHRELAPAVLNLINGLSAVGKTSGYHNYVPTEELVMSFNQQKDKRYKWLYQFATNPRISTGPSIRKGFDITSANQNLGGANYLLLRFSDVLLIKAECSNMRGSASEAKQYVDIVRARAGLSPLAAGLSKEAMQDSIMLERRLEFAHEAGNRLYDLRRTGTYIKEMNNFLQFRKSFENTETLTIINPSFVGQTPKEGDQTNGGDYFEIPVPFVSGTKIVDEKHLFHPIPNWDLKENPNLRNNLHTPNWN